MKRIIILLSGTFVMVAIMIGVSFIAPLPIPAFQDFSVMYFTDKGLLNGISIYAYPQQLAFVRTLTNPDFSFFPYPYPPWYALSTLFLGYLPVQVAARTWFFLNLGMISLSAWLLTPSWHGIQRILAAFAAVMFIPAFGLLIVGQYSAPVLLGSALYLYAIRVKTPFWIAVSLLLLTFKPHIGGLLFLAGFVWLIFEKSSFARRALKFTLIGMLLLAGLGFLADSAWPLNYIVSLSRYRDIPGVQTCGLCASLSISLLRLFTGQSNTLVAALLSLFTACGLIFLLLWRYRAKLVIPAYLMALSASLTLLIDPYLLNYDYLLLLIPLFMLVRHSWPARFVYFIPWAVLVLGRSGNILLSITGLVTFILILRSSIDATSPQAYNDLTIF